QPVSNLSRRTKAIWNILNQEKKRSNVIAWWPSSPVEPINGVMVSNHYQSVVAPLDEPWPMPDGTVHPGTLADQFAEARFHPQELMADAVQAFVPDAHKIDQDKDKRLVSVMKILAECTSVHSATTLAMDQGDWDLTAVYHDAIDHFCHGFMKFHPPRRKHIHEEDYELYKGVIDAAYCYHDMMLGGLLQKAGEDTTVIIVSDHGFHPDHNRPVEIPTQPAGPAIEHRDFGIFVAAGPGIKHDEIIHGASQLDVTPTILSLFDLPIGNDMDGRVLSEIYQQEKPISYINSWDEVAGDCAMYSAEEQSDPIASKEAIKQLIALGYIDEMGGDMQKNVTRMANELQFNLAMSYMDANIHTEAVPILENLYTENPDQHRYGIQLSLCYRALEDIPALEKLVERLHKRRITQSENAQEALKKFQAKENLPEDISDEKLREWISSLSDHNKKVWKRLKVESNIPVFDTEYLRGYVAAAKGKHEEALKHLLIAEKAQSIRPGLQIQIGETYLYLKQWENAERAFNRALKIESENPHAYLGLARVYLSRRRPKPAAQAAIKTISLIYEYPMAHFCLGRALIQMKRYQEAETAILIAIKQNPNFKQAHTRIALLYERQLMQADKAREHRAVAKLISKEQIRQNKNRNAFIKDQSKTVYHPHLSRRGSYLNKSNKCINIVTGLPRSGTSMMMQMLQKGGLTLLSDEQRQADENNPRGYYEYADVMRLHTDNSWIGEGIDRCLKVIAQLIQNLPDEYDYRIVFMQRDMDEVLASQSTMLGRLKSAQQSDDNNIRKAYNVQLNQLDRWISTKNNIEILYVDYSKAIENPRSTAEALNRFNNGKLDEQAMCIAVDPTLYRERADLQTSEDTSTD
ncbi:MAG TPA: tetratricopeptide repeat protein, partial [Gammaproteobacteria bacterium]|nr:tetratricopeptide repeat protein [Gammaproteobacteria bacterium]